MNQHTVLFLSHQVVENGHGVSLTTLFAPLLEPEIIFELTADLPEDADTQTILESVKIAPGIEIPDARYKVVPKFHFR